MFTSPSQVYAWRFYFFKPNDNYNSLLCSVIIECAIIGLQTMKKIRQDISYNQPNAKNKEYDRTVYQCIVDDVWATIEVPKKLG